MFCGVRAGMNPAPTNPPLQTTFKIGDNSPQFSVKGDNVGAGFIPALTLLSVIFSHRDLYPWRTGYFPWNHSERKWGQLHKSVDAHHLPN